MSNGIRNWSAAIFLLGLGAAAGWLLRGTPPRPDAPPVRAGAAPLRAPITPAAEEKHGAPASPRPALAKKPEETPWPPAGESLTFTAHLAKLNNVAVLRLLAGERSDFLGKKSMHLQALADTQNPLRMVFELDDRFDSYSETAAWTSQQYEMHLSERGQKQSVVLRLSSGAEPAPAGMIAARVLPGTRDPLGMLVYLRKVDWTKTAEVSSPVFEGRKLYEVRARLVSRAEPVKVPAGEFQALKIAVQVFENGKEFKDASFVVYLAAAGAAGLPTPVLLEAALPIGNARVELVSAN